jgi:hypothetical protein
LSRSTYLLYNSWRWSIKTSCPFLICLKSDLSLDLLDWHVAKISHPIFLTDMSRRSLTSSPWLTCRGLSIDLLDWHVAKISYSISLTDMSRRSLIRSPWLTCRGDISLDLLDWHVAEISPSISLTDMSRNVLTLLTCSPYMSRCVRSEWTPITGHMLMTLGVRPIKTAISSLCKL